MAIVDYISVDFDVSPRIIWIDTTSSTSISVQNLIDTCMHISALSANMDDAILLESSGKEYLVADGSVKVGLTVTLNNAKIAFKSLGGPDWILCSIEGGNVVSVEDIYTSPRVYIPVVHPTPFITVERVSSSSATLSELSAIQYASYNGFVTIDILNGVVGTTYNIGTLENPVNNVPDALTIANERGFEKFYVHGNLTLGVGHNVDGFEFCGHSPSKTTITIEDAASTVGCEFQECTIGGILDSNNILDHCIVNTLSYVNGEIRNSRLVGPITLGGGANALFLDCGSSIPTSPPIIDMGGSGQTCVFHDYSGGLNLQNMNGSNYIGVQLDGGKVLIDPTISAGSVIIVGIGLITDNSTGTCVVNTDGLINAEAINNPVWDECTIDTTNGEAGIAYPLGTHGNPVNNLTDALTICSNNNIEKLCLYTDLIVEASHDISGKSIETHGIMGIDVILEINCSSNNTVFRYLNLHGIINNNDVLLVENCTIGNLNNFNGIIQDVTLKPNCVLTIDNSAELYNCRANGEEGSEFEINIGNSILNIHQYRGNLKLINKTGSNRTILGGDSVNVIIESSCISGTIQLLGTGILTDNSAGAIVDDKFVDATTIKSIDKKTKLIPGLL